MWQRVAGIILGILIGSGFFLAFNAEARADFMSWVRSTYENSILYEFFQGAKKDETTLPEIEFTWLPGEYEIQEVFNDGRKSTIILSSTKDTMVLNCWLIGMADHYEVFTADYQRVETKVDEQNADFFQSLSDDTANILVWTDPECSVEYNLNAMWSEQIMVQIAQGISQKIELHCLESSS